MNTISQQYELFCKNLAIDFKYDNMVNPYDDTTLFCPAGMQQFKEKYKAPDGTTIANIQSCIRVQDLEEIGDGSHLLYFNMLGLFSFGEWTMQKAVDFWVLFIQETLGIGIDVVTIHPDKFDSWKELYAEYPSITLKPDPDCTWTDGELGGYCTEFYKDGLEIGNIVNTSDKYIDAGFGLERIESLLGHPVKSASETLKEAVHKIIESGYEPSNQKQGYVLRKLLREVYKRGDVIDHPLFYKEKERQEVILLRYQKIKDKYPNKSNEWWFDTHGIDISLLT
jgi:alanyl-tRNA synthetase